MKALFIVSLLLVSQLSCSTIRGTRDTPSVKFADNEFYISSGKDHLHLHEWNNDVDLKKLFGTPHTDTSYVLDDKADTHAGSRIRTQTYPGLTLIWFGPADHNNAWLQQAVVYSPRYTTAHGLRVGDSYAKLRQLIPGLRCRPKDSGTECYFSSENTENNLYFLVHGDTISSYRIYYMIP